MEANFYNSNQQIHREPRRAEAWSVLSSKFIGHSASCPHIMYGVDVMHHHHHQAKGYQHFPTMEIHLFQRRGRFQECIMHGRLHVQLPREIEENWTVGRACRSPHEIFHCWLVYPLTWISLSTMADIQSIFRPHPANQICNLCFRDSDCVVFR